MNLAIDTMVNKVSHLECLKWEDIPCTNFSDYRIKNLYRKGDILLFMSFTEEVHLCQHTSTKTLTYCRSDTITIGRSRGCAQHMPPLQDQILSFLHIFSAKSASIRGPCPPNGSMPPVMGNPGSATD